MPAAPSPGPTGSAADESAAPAPASGPWKTTPGVSCSACSCRVPSPGTNHLVWWSPERPPTPLHLRLQRENDGSEFNMILSVYPYFNQYHN